MHAGAFNDPIAVFRFALKERDWILADLIATALTSRSGGHQHHHRLALVAELGSVARDQHGAPRSLGALRVWATLVRQLEDAGNGSVR